MPNSFVGASVGSLLPLFERERAAGPACVLAVVLRTQGSTYRKPGATMLIAAGGEYAGLLSGGCLENDARPSLRYRTKQYDSRYDRFGSRDRP